MPILASVPATGLLAMILIVAFTWSAQAQRQAPSLANSETSPPQQRRAAHSGPFSTNPSEPSPLPNSHGQVERKYDIRAYTESVPDETKPEQAIVEWILRETGTEVWFSQPFGFLSANRSELRVYHTPAIQRTVADIVDRFVHGDAGAYAFGARMITVQSPNWRSWAYARMQSVPVQSPGVEAWLVAREDAAVILAQLSGRADFREHSSPNMLIQNARTHQISRMHPMAYVKSVTNRPEALGAGALGAALQTPVMGQVEQGFKLKVSPLLSADERTVDAIVKLETNQIEKLSSVRINPVSINAQRGVTIQVPQTSSWRLHERFRWPVDRVLLVSCGVVAAPTPRRSSSLGLLGSLNGGAARVEALLFLEAKGKTAATGSLRPRVAARTNHGRYQGRY